MNTNKWIWLDMDGTFVNFYGVENWLDYLIKKDPTPYRIAEPIYNMAELIEVLLELKENGYNVGVISWLSKTPNVGFDKKVIKAKMDWLERNLIADILDEIIITSYGKVKSATCEKYGYGVLCDDEEQNRNAWKNGATIDANKNLIKELKKLLTY